MKKEIIALCGFMGCGKTTVGKELARLLSYPFFDSDDVIAKTHHLKINDIFKHFGEKKFREFETDAIKTILSNQKAVVSLGGGAVINQENLELLKQTTLVFLDTPYDLISKRLKKSSDRPLVNNNDDEYISALYTKRYPFYKSAADIILISDQTPQNTAKKIISYMNIAG